MSILLKKFFTPNCNLIFFAERHSDKSWQSLAILFIQSLTSSLKLKDGLSTSSNRYAFLLCTYLFDCWFAHPFSLVFLWTNWSKFFLYKSAGHAVLKRNKISFIKDKHWDLGKYMKDTAERKLMNIAEINPTLAFFV